MCVDLVVVRVCVCSALCSSLFFFCCFLERGGAFCSPWLSHGFERYELKKGQFFGGHSSLSVSNTLYMCACVLPSSITAACRTKKISALLRFLTSLYFLLLAFITSLICSSRSLFFFSSVCHFSTPIHVSCMRCLLSILDTFLFLFLLPFT